MNSPSIWKIQKASWNAHSARVRSQSWATTCGILHINGKQQRQDCTRFDLFIALLNRNGFNFNRIDLIDLVKRIGDSFAETCTNTELFAADGCSVTAAGQLRCRQGHWAVHRVSKPIEFLSQNLGRTRNFRTTHYFLSGVWTPSSYRTPRMLQCRQ